jgi:SSS family solute:Na+ symporter
MAVIVIVSLFTKKPEEHQLRKLTYAGATDDEKAETLHSWNRWDVIHSAIIIGVIMAVYWYFW